MREPWAIRVDRKLKAIDVIDVLSDLFDGEIFYSLREAQIIIESWRRRYNTVRPHASLGYRPPAPEVFVPAFAAWLTLAQRQTLN